jgi:hypothetical protein
MSVRATVSFASIKDVPKKYATFIHKIENFSIEITASVSRETYSVASLHSHQL